MAYDLDREGCQPAGGLRPWDDPRGLGHSLYNRMLSSGMTTPMFVGHSGFAQSSLLRARVPLVSDVLARWGLGHRVQPNRSYRRFPNMIWRSPVASRFERNAIAEVTQPMMVTGRPDSRADRCARTSTSHTARVPRSSSASTVFRKAAAPFSAQTSHIAAGDAATQSQGRSAGRGGWNLNRFIGSGPINDNTDTSQLASRQRATLNEGLNVNPQQRTENPSFDTGQFTGPQDWRMVKGQTMGGQRAPPPVIGQSAALRPKGLVARVTGAHDAQSVVFSDYGTLPLVGERLLAGHADAPQIRAARQVTAGRAPILAMYSGDPKSSTDSSRNPAASFGLPGTVAAGGAVEDSTTMVSRAFDENRGAPHVQVDGVGTSGGPDSGIPCDRMQPLYRLVTSPAAAAWRFKQSSKRSISGGVQAAATAVSKLEDVGMLARMPISVIAVGRMFRKVNPMNRTAANGPGFTKYMWRYGVPPAVTPGGRRISRPDHMDSSSKRIPRPCGVFESADGGTVSQLRSTPALMSGHQIGLAGTVTKHTWRVQRPQFIARMPKSLPSPGSAKILPAVSDTQPAQQLRNIPNDSGRFPAAVMPSEQRSPFSSEDFVEHTSCDRRTSPTQTAAVVYPHPLSFRWGQPAQTAAQQPVSLGLGQGIPAVQRSRWGAHTPTTLNLLGPPFLRRPLSAGIIIYRSWSGDDTPGTSDREGVVRASAVMGALPAAPMAKLQLQSAPPPGQLLDHTILWTGNAVPQPPFVHRVPKTLESAAVAVQTATPDAIQRRQPAEISSDVDTTPPPVSEPREAEGTAAADDEAQDERQTDLDDLVDKIWRKFMRKLSIEQERRGRMTWV